MNEILSTLAELSAIIRCALALYQEYKRHGTEAEQKKKD